MMRSRPRTAGLLLGVLVSVGGGVLALGQAPVQAPIQAPIQEGDLRSRIERLRAESRYELALDLLEDHESRGEHLGPQLQWLRTQLERDPDRFDRLGLQLWNELEPGDPLRARITLARAKEHFARGRYETAAEYLRGLSAETARSLPEVSLYLGMASQALGEVRNATLAFETVPEGAEEFGFAQALLAELALREGRLDRAADFAERALESSSADLGAQALLVLVRVAEQRGETEVAARHRARLNSGFPRSAEAAWLRESNAGPPAVTGAAQASRFREIEAPAQRRSFALQFGAFHDRSLALRMAGEIEGKADALRIELDRSVEPPWYRVVGGDFVTRAQADAALGRLREAGVDAVVLAPGRGGR